MNVDDWSDYQEGASVDALADAGARWLILKASEGAGWRSRTMPYWRERAHARGLLVGLYHFAHDNDVAAEVDNFLGAIGGLEDHEVVIYDWETPNPASAGQAQEWLEVVEAQTHRLELLYANPGFLAAQPTAGLTRWPLWISGYGIDDGQEHSWPATDRWAPFQDGPGSYPYAGRTVLWQYTSRGWSAGYDAPHDVSRFDGTEADLIALGGGGGPAPPPPNPDPEDRQGRTMMVLADPA